MNFFKKLSKLKLLWGLCALVFAGALLSCVVDDKDDDDNKTEQPSSGTELRGVSISGTAEIEADKSSTLTAAPKFTNASGDSSSVTYKWEITGGSEYATLSESSENTVTITGKNATTSEQTVDIKVTATYNNNSVSATYSVKIAAVGVTIKDELTELTITPAATSVSATGTVDLTATASYTGNPSITFKWAITEGGDYASLESENGRAAQTITKTNTLTGKNTTDSEQTVKVKVTASDGTNTKTATYSITVGAKFVVPAVEKITVYSGIAGTSKIGEYETVKEALAACGSSGDFRIVLPVGTYAENGLVYNGSGTIRISGAGSAAHGTDVVIKGHGSTMPVDGGSSAQNARELLLFKGTGNLILENLTLESDWLRSEHKGVSAMQAEVLGFNASGYVAAYNCSFKSHQDTVRTVGKGWFYDCYIEGDVDFIWMEAGGKVALYEKCEIVSVYDEAASNHATYIAAPKINLGDTAGKGVVVFNSKITAPANQKTYLFRNPWSSTPDNQYNQAAFVNCTIDGTLEGALSSSDANGTPDQQYIGWKVDSEIASAYSKKAEKIGTLSAATEEKEYSGRRAILNRNYMVDSARFEKDTASNWDIDDFINTIGWSVDTDDSKDYYDGEEISVVTVWDFTKYEEKVINIQNKTGTVSATSGEGTLEVDATASGKLYSRGTDAQFNTGTKIYIPATEGEKISVVGHNGYYTLGATTASVASTSITVSSADLTTYNGKSCVLLEATNSEYLYSITVTGTGSAAGGENGGESGGSGSGGTGEKVSYTLTFNGSSEVDEADYFTANAAGISSGRLKVNSSGYIQFTTSGAATVTVTSVYSNTTASSISQWGIFKDSSATATVSGPVHNNTTTADTTEYTESVELSEAGTYKIARNNGSSKEFFISKVVVTEVSGSSSGGTGGSGGSESGGSGSGESGGETGSNVISKNDTPTGFANIDVSKFTTEKTVTTAAELISYAKKGGYLIYVSGEIDISEGKLPSSAGGTTSALDSFVSSKSSYSTYEAFKTAYAAACSADTNDKSSSSPGSSLGSVLWKLNKAYGELIKITVASDTAIIGLNGAVVKGGTFQISSADNVVIRNLTIKDAYDPFPHHEAGDQFNAQWDNVSVTTSTNVWIDHCTFEDTMLYSKVTISDGSTQEKWQTYDGLCDITKTSKNVVVSYCEFKNHDKSMLIGSSKDDVSGESITIHHNRFLNCGQRLPMTCWANMHIYNNYYERDSKAYYSQQACIAARYSAYTIIAENNYFGSGITKAITPSTSPSGSCYINGNYFAEGSSACTLTTTSTKPFTPSYTYTPDAAADLPTLIPENAGAGVWSVVQ